ncbi:MAG: hypothetical protein ACRDHL_10970, partial [Candidatus Promineifilaceae bacterium]
MKPLWKISLIGLPLLALAALLGGSAGNAAAAEGPIVSESVFAGQSPAVRDLAPGKDLRLEGPLLARVNPLAGEPDGGRRGTWDRGQVPTDALIGAPAGGGTPGLDFDFAGVGNPQACGGCSPPDTVGDTGPNHYIQMVNATKVAIFDKSGVLLTPVFDLGDLWTSGNCTANTGDPIVLYDGLADRWLLSQFAFPSHMCVAISQTADPLADYHLYEFNVGAFPDYFKFGVWPDAYYMSANESSYTAYAFDRDNMLTGAAATFQKFTGEDNLLLPADLDGPAAPPAGTPGYFYTFKDNSFHGGSDRIELFELDVDWDVPGNTTFSLVETFTIASYTYTVCGFFNFDCIRQMGTGQRVDAVSEWPMHRFPYRNFGAHQTLLGTFTIGGGLGEEGAAIRWFELRNMGSGWTLFQEGTHDPGDGHDRFMGSIAMDASGNIALGYSVSSSAMFPAIRYATRLASDPPGTLQAEATLIAGGGSQTASNRWGDYSAMSVDPANDCSFWYTNEYYPVSGPTNWQTRVGVFTQPECGGLVDFTIDATPETQAICQGDDALYEVAVGSIGGFSDPVTLSADGNPGTATFDPNPVTPPGTSELTISDATAGNYTFDIVGTAGITVHETTVSLDVYAAAPAAPSLIAPPDGATDVSVTPTFEWSAVANAAAYELEVATDAGFSSIVYMATVAGTSHTAESPLASDTTHYWRVRASNPCGDGPNSAVFSFTTADIPPVLLVDDDDNAPDVQATYTAVLNTILGLDGYDL